MRILVVIPAKSTSEGVSSKNMKVLDGHPLIYYTIHEALSARLTRVLVSADDPTIVEYARSQGADAVLHPAALSNAQASTYPVIRWALDHASSTGDTYDCVVTLRATSPLRLALDIQRGLDTFAAAAHADSCVSLVAAVGIHFLRLKKLTVDGFVLDAFEKEGYSPIRRQAFERFYIRNGAVYISLPEVIRSRGLWGDRCAAYLMPEDRSLNINTEFQFRLAELLIKARRSSGSLSPS